MKYLKELKKLNLPADSFAIFGSGPMAIRNMRPTNDLDLIVKFDLWLKLREKYFPYLVQGNEDKEIRINNISIFSHWQPWFDNINDLIDTADLIDGVRYVKLEHVLKWKKEMARDKDLKDIAIIKKYLHEN